MKEIAAIRLEKWGEFLSTRQLGKAVREEVLKALVRANGGTSAIIVDFRGVDLMTHSFADECFGKLIDQIKRKQIHVGLRVSNASEELKSILRYVISRHEKELSIA